MFPFMMNSCLLKQDGMLLFFISLFSIVHSRRRQNLNSIRRLLMNVPTVFILLHSEQHTETMKRLIT